MSVRLSLSASASLSVSALVLDLADEGSFYSLGCPWGMLTFFAYGL